MVLRQALGGYDFVQFITLDKSGRQRLDIAREWIKTLSQAIRQKDQRHLITVGLLPSTKSGVIYRDSCPRGGAGLDLSRCTSTPSAANSTKRRVVKQFAVGKPLVIEETFDSTCSSESFGSSCSTHVA